MSTSQTDSLTLRFILAIKALWQKGLFGRLGQAWQSGYAQSQTRKHWERFLAAPDPVLSSWYGRRAAGLSAAWRRWGWLVERSWVGRALLELGRAGGWLAGHSSLCRLVSRLSLRQWLLVAFALYLPLEYLFRNVVRVALLAAVWEELFIAAAIGLLLWQSALRKKTTLCRATTLETYLILFMAVGLLLMMLVRPHPAVAFAGYRAVVEYMIWFFLIVRLVGTPQDARVLYGTVLLLSGLLCLHGIYQYIVAVPIPATWVSQTEMGVRTRVFSLTGSPNIFGSLIVLTAPMMAAMVYYLKRPAVKLLFAGLTGLMCLCLLFTFSRGAWVGMVVAVLVFALLVDRRLIGLMGLAAALAVAFVPSITSRLTYLFTADYVEASALGGRSLRWEIGRLLLTDNNPWLGFGLGRFGGAVAMNNQLLDKTDTFQYFYMDNYYLKTMVEMGYIGLAAFLVTVAAALIWGLRAVYRSGLGGPINQKAQDALTRWSGNQKIPAAGILAGQVGVLVHCYFENIFEEPYMMAYFWGLSGLLLCIGFFLPKESS